MNLKTDETWMACEKTCPACGSKHTCYDMATVLTSLPEQYHFKCIDCGNDWTGIFDINIGTVTPNIPSYEPPKISGSYGWICPVCGAGVSPYQDHCPCCSGKNWTPTWTCGSGSISSDGVGDYQIYNSNPESNVGICSSKVGTAINKTDAGLLINAENEIKNNIRKQDKNGNK